MPGKCRGLGYYIAVMRRKQEASKEGQNMDVWHCKELLANSPSSEDLLHTLRERRRNFNDLQKIRSSSTFMLLGLLSIIMV